ncbi:copper resistance CopC family protein [Rhodococcus aerolatus]
MLVLLLAGLAAAAGAGVASAHAGLVSVDPADGSTGAPTRAVLVFTDPLQPEFVTVTLTDADGTQISLAAPEVLDTTVTQPLPALPAGPVTLAYRVLSEDGHRVEGSTGYTVTSGASSAPAPQLTGAATVTPPPPTTTSALVQPAAADDTAGSPPPWLVAVPVAILVVGAAAAATVVMRGRRTR